MHLMMLALLFVVDETDTCIERNHQCFIFFLFFFFFFVCWCYRYNSRAPFEGERIVDLDLVRSTNSCPAFNDSLALFEDVFIHFASFRSDTCDEA